MQKLNKKAPFAVKGLLLVATCVIVTAMPLGQHTQLRAQFIQPPEERREEGRAVNPPLNETTFDAEQVRNLRAELAPQSNNIIMLTWLPAAVQDDFIIARSTAPIATLDLLLAAKFIAVVPPGTASFLDQSLEPGSYYYAVASRNAIRDKRVVLRVGENYTGTPVIVMQRTQETTRDLPPPQVSLIFAQARNNQIRISWRGVAAPGVSYVVYRAAFPIATPEDVARATQLAILPQGQEFYNDNQLPGPGTYYYAVATRSANGIQDNRLVPDQSYTREGVRFGGSELPVVRNLQAAVVPGRLNEVQLSWIEPPDALRGNFTYRIFRATSRIDREEVLASAAIAGEVSAGTTAFNDRELRPGQYFYAVVTLAADNQQSTRLIPGENITAGFVTVGSGSDRANQPGSNEETAPRLGAPVFTDLLALARGDSVILTWKLSGSTNPSSRLHLYRFERQPRSLADLPEGELVAKLDSEQQIYEDIPPQQGVYYYAILLQTPRGLVPPGFELGRNLTGAVAYHSSQKKRAEPTLEDEDLEPPELPQASTTTEKTKPAVKEITPEYSEPAVNSVIRATYLRGQYREAITQLASFTRSSDNRIAAKALFYTGLSYYSLKNYRKALDFFVHPKVVNAYGNTARFWYRQTLEKLQQ